MVRGFVLMTLGAVVIALPDDDDRLFSLSEDHGPSALDALGIVVPRGGGAIAVLTAAFAAGAAVLAVGIGFDLGALWVLGAATMAAVQLYLLSRALRAPR